MDQRDSYQIGIVCEKKYFLLGREVGALSLSEEDFKCQGRLPLQCCAVKKCLVIHHYFGGAFDVFAAAIRRQMWTFQQDRASIYIANSTRPWFRQKNVSVR